VRITNARSTISIQVNVKIDQIVLRSFVFRSRPRWAATPSS